MTTVSLGTWSKWTLPAALCALIPTLVSCGEDEDDKLANASSFCEEWGKKACNDTVIARCGAPDEESCVDAQKDFCLTLVDEGAYSKSGAKECLDEVEDAYFDGDLSGADMRVVLELGAPCDRVQSGSTPGGGRCTKNSDCDLEAGYACVTRLQESGEPSGQCQIPEERGGGQRCTSPEVQCAEGFYCDGTNCISKAEAGEQCSNIDPCADDLKCVIADGDTEGECETRASAGSSCEEADDCSSGICSASANDGLICTNTIVLEISKDICDNFRPAASSNSRAQVTENANTAADAGSE